MDVIFLKSLRPLYCDYISRILCVRRAQQRRPPRPPFMYFDSRPYARGNRSRALRKESVLLISTHAPTRGATIPQQILDGLLLQFLLTHLREGRPAAQRMEQQLPSDFYSRPYARGDRRTRRRAARRSIFLLAPLREGRPVFYLCQQAFKSISTRAPTRGATCLF